MVSALLSLSLVEHTVRRWTFLLDDQVSHLERNGADLFFSIALLPSIDDHNFYKTQIESSVHQHCAFELRYMHNYSVYTCERNENGMEEEVQRSLYLPH